jgi:hypothetical protein
MNDDISLPFVALLIPLGLFCIIYTIRGVIKGVINPEYSRGGKPINRREKPFMFWTYITGIFLMGLFLIIYAVFFILEKLVG